jgi:hypothetical protein
MSTQPSLASGWAAAWNRYFFSEEAPFGLALIRICLPWVLVVDGVFRWPHARELYSADGAAAPLALNFGYAHFLPEFPGPVAVALHTAMLFFLVTASLGWCTRLSLVGGTFLYFYFGYMDVVSTITKYSCCRCPPAEEPGRSTPGSAGRKPSAWVCPHRRRAPPSGPSG